MRIASWRRDARTGIGGTFSFLGHAFGALRQNLVGLVVGAFLIVADPFGLGDELALQSGEVFNAIFTELYEPAPAGTIAVLVTENTLRGDASRPAKSWPLAYAEHAEYLRQILDKKPRLLVIDLLFLDDRWWDRTEGVLAQAILCAQVPVVVAVSPDADRPDHERFRAQILPQSVVCDDGGGRQATAVNVSKAASTKFGVSPSGMRLLPEGLDGSFVSIPLSAHLALNCTRLPRGSIPSTDQGCDPEQRAALFQRDMAVFWGGPDTVNEARCAAVPTSFHARFLPLAAAGFVAKVTRWHPPLGAWLDQRLSGRDPEAARRGQNDPCLHVLAIDASSIAAAGAILAGRVVVYGASIEGMADLWRSSMAGNIAGPVIVGMAIDNLLRWDHRYLGKQALPPSEAVRAPTAPRAVLVFAILLGGSLVLVWLASLLWPPSQRWSAYNALVVLALLPSLLVCAYAQVQPLLSDHLALEADWCGWLAMCVAILGFGMFQRRAMELIGPPGKSFWPSVKTTIAYTAWVTSMLAVLLVAQFWLLRLAPSNWIAVGCFAILVDILSLPFGNESRVARTEKPIRS